ncbi:hypothetical protein ACQUSR_19215 [Streptomyces sp. P1-3]|uniref:hypothetical protein n=1 Tax=Streptomyces sp. P1-3 TaxID=3421658 RepID=UPI003D36B096
MTTEAPETADQPGQDLGAIRRMLSEGLAESGGGNRSIMRLTDEELAVIDLVDPEDGLVPLPHLSSLSESERAVAISTALRSLISRELIEVANIEQLDDLMREQEAATAAGQSTGHRTPLDIRMTEEASLVLNLRRTAERALVGEINTSDGMSHCFVYVHSPELFLVERITTGGLHLFSLTNSSVAAAELVHGLVDPFGVADRDGRIQQLDPHALDRENVGGPLQKVIDKSLVVGRLMVLADDPGALVLTYAADVELWTVTVDRPHSPTGIVAQAVSERTLARKIQGLLKLPE